MQFYVRRLEALEKISEKGQRSELGEMTLNLFTFDEQQLVPKNIKKKYPKFFQLEN